MTDDHAFGFGDFATPKFTRRTLLSGAAAAMSASAVPSLFLAAQQAPAAEDKSPFCAFVKFVQTLSYDELAERIAEMGYDGIEATVRDGGQIEPERAPDELPKLVEALDKHGLKVTILASSINRADEPHTERLLRAAALLGIPRYRMKYYRYDLKQPVVRQLQEFKPMAKDLAAMNHGLGITGLYQNHAGAAYVGSTVWDLRELMSDIPATDMAIAFDIRHATAEAGLSWPVLFNVAQPHLGAVYLKDFAWKEGKPENVPLGQGQVDKGFASLVKRAQFTGPISVHVEYLEDAGIPENLAGLRNDLQTAKQWFG